MSFKFKIQRIINQRDVITIEQEILGDIRSEKCQKQAGAYYQQAREFLSDLEDSRYDILAEDIKKDMAEYPESWIC